MTVQQVLSKDGVRDNPDNHPSFVRWAVQTRAAKLQQKSALQEQIRALGIEIAAIEKVIQDADKSAV